MKNKKGDIPVTILVIGVIAVCILAIASFYISKGKVEKDFSSVELVKAASLINDKISLYENLGYTYEEIRTMLGIQTDQVGDYITFVSGKVSVRYTLPNN